MPASRLPPDFATCAAYPLYAIDAVQDRGWVLRFDPIDYANAPLLDQRGLRPGMAGGRSGGAECVYRHGRRGPPTGHWLFHIGHCGSTLASRLLDQVPGVLGLFEALLAVPADATRRLAQHFGLTAPDDLAKRIETSGLMGRYAKDAAQPFDSVTRRRELDQAHARFRSAIDAGVHWAERAIAAGDEYRQAARLRAQP